MIADPALAHALHAAFESSALLLGAWLYRRAGPEGRSAGGGAPINLERGFPLLVGLLLGAGLGNKAVYLIERPEVAAALWRGEALWPGQSIVGGLLGGLLGLELAKRLSGQPASTGDRIVLPLILALAWGRVGCALAGVHDDTHGLPSRLPWALDGGDGVPRHPTALYEIAFLLALAAGLRALTGRWPRLDRVAGLRFKLFLSAYLLWRLGVECLKPVPHAYPLGLSGIQWVCALALLLYLPLLWRALRR